MRRPYVKKAQPESKADTAELEPGSVVIFTSTGSSGEPVYKVFMVTPGQDKTPLNLNQAVLDDLTKSLNNDTPVVNAQNILTIAAEGIIDAADQSIAEENNVTIPASEDVTMRPALASDNEQIEVECNDKLSGDTAENAVEMS